MKNVFVELLISLILLVYGSVVAYCYSYGKKIKQIKIKMLVPKSKFSIVYTVFSVIACVVLPILLYVFYPDNLLLKNLRLVSLVAFLLPIAAVDFRMQKIPNWLVGSAIVVRVFIFAFEAVLYTDSALSIIKDCLLGAVLMGGFFFLLMLLFKNSIGMGDVKLFFVMGLYQGVWGSVNSVFFSLMVSFIVSVILLLTKRKRKKDTISFAPSILIGTVVSIVLSGM